MEQLREWISEKLSDHKPGEAPARQLWVEALGFFVIFVGMFLVVCLVSYDRTDVAKISGGEKALQNLVGPLGAMLAHGFIKTIGMVSYAWPPALIVWGFLWATGIIRKPKKRRFVIFFLATVIGASFLQVLYPDSDLINGQGGSIGQWIGLSVVGAVGKLGAFLFLAFTAIVSLIFTRNMTFSFSKKPKKVPTPDGTLIDATNEFRSQVYSESETEDKNGLEIPGTQPELTTPTDPGLDPNIKMDLLPATKAPAKPNLNLFKAGKITSAESDDDAEVSNQLTEKLEEFKVKGEIVGITQGPVVKTYEFEPAAGTKVAKIEALQPDLARLLKSDSLRVVPVSGASTLGFEVPNPDRKIIPFGNVVNSKEFSDSSLEIPIAMGVDTFGNPVVEDLVSMPHLLVAGSTGSGKSVFINTLISSLLVSHSAKDLRMILVDPKMVELSMFNDTAHLACEVVTDIEKQGLGILKKLVNEMELRYKALNQTGAKNITSFNKIIKTEKKGSHKKFTGKWQQMPYVVVIVDEYADLIMALGKEAELAITRLAQKARAAGIHLVIATQRPSANVVTGVIKANFPTRVAFRVTSGIDSRTILDQSGADSLLGNGDMLFLSSKGLNRLHSTFMTDDELKKLVKACKK